MSTKRDSAARRGAIASLVLLVIFLAAWEWGPGLLGIPSFIIPPASAVAAEGVRMWNVSHLLFHTGVTFAEVVVGFAIGSLLGAVIGYLLGMSPAAELVLSPYILALQIAPKVAFAPLFVLWMGFSVSSTWRVRSRRRVRRFSGRSSFPHRCRRPSRACALPQRWQWWAW
jgi:NitT/TauT family transport system permease protein